MRKFLVIAMLLATIASPLEAGGRRARRRARRSRASTQCRPVQHYQAPQSYTSQPGYAQPAYGATYATSYAQPAQPAYGTAYPTTGSYPMATSTAMPGAASYTTSAPTAANSVPTVAAPAADAASSVLTSSPESTEVDAKTAGDTHPVADAVDSERTELANGLDDGLDQPGDDAITPSDQFDNGEPVDGDLQRRSNELRDTELQDAELRDGDLQDNEFGDTELRDTESVDDAVQDHTQRSVDDAVSDAEIAPDATADQAASADSVQSSSETAQSVAPVAQPAAVVAQAPATTYPSNCDVLPTVVDGQVVSTGNAVVSSPGVVQHSVAYPTTVHQPVSHTVVHQPATQSVVQTPVVYAQNSYPQLTVYHQSATVPASGQVVYAAAPTTMAQPVAHNSALAELNAIRARRGLYAFIEDPSLSAIAYQKAAIQARNGRMAHPGGTMGGARYEGVGMGPQFTSCYQFDRSARYAGAATVVGRNGQRFHCLLIK